MPRSTNDFNHSGRSFLSAGTSELKSSRVNGPAIAGRHGISNEIPPIPSPPTNRRRERFLLDPEVDVCWFWGVDGFMAMGAGLTACLAGRVHQIMMDFTVIAIPQSRQMRRA